MVPTGRTRESEEIVQYERAVEVAKLMLGRLNGPMKRIFLDAYITLPRRNLKHGKADVKTKRTEVEKFCRENFRGASIKKLAAFYEDVFKHGSQYRLPLTEFIKRVGEPLDGRLRGAPLHSTVCISPWGLQTEYPEMHLSQDLAVAYNAALELDQRIAELEGQALSWSDAKMRKEEIAPLQSRRKFHMRSCLIGCFNLLEAYVNGLAWEHFQRGEMTHLSNRQRKMLQGDQTSILKKLVEVPKIVKGKEIAPLSTEQPPLSELRDLIKPFRDSIVHASPFSAPEQFGGYNKLSKVYTLEFQTVKAAVGLSLETISIIHHFICGEAGGPHWLPKREENGSLVV